MQQPGYDIIAQFMIGYALPGKPIANLLFKIYGRISTVHALSFLADLKLGHYMKIPPRCMYTAQVRSGRCRRRRPLQQTFRETPPAYE